jgi:hypothetical protein
MIGAADRENARHRNSWPDHVYMSNELMLVSSTAYAARSFIRHTAERGDPAEDALQPPPEPDPGINLDPDDPTWVSSPTSPSHIDADEPSPEEPPSVAPSYPADPLHPTQPATVDPWELPSVGPKA